MTAFRNSPVGTATYQPPASDVRADVFSIANPPQSQPSQSAPPPFEYLLFGRNRWRVTIRDLTAGLNMQRGEMSIGQGRLKSASLDHRYRNHLTLPFLQTLAATPTTGNDSAMRGQYGVNVAGSLVIAMGAATAAGNGPVLFKETSATDPTIASITWNPGVNAERVRSAQAIVIGGTTTNPRLAVGLVTLGVKVFSDLAGTVAGTMHADTVLCDGIIQTPVNDNALLIYSNGALRSLAASSAITDAPTSQLTSVPPGGWAIGLLALGGAPIRAFWVWPDSNVTPTLGGAPPLFDGVRYRIIHTNMEGLDPQELRIPGLTNIYAADRVRDGIVATDGYRVFFYNGRFFRDLGLFLDRPISSGRKRYCLGFWIKAGTELYVRWVEEGNGDSVTWGEERYDWDLNAFQSVSVTTTESTATSDDFFIAGKSMPVSEQTNFLHHYVRNAGWYRQFQPSGLDNPFTFRKTQGGTAATGQQFATTGTATLPTMIFPAPHDRDFKIVDSIWFGGDLDAGGIGGTPAHIEITAGGQPGVFKGSSRGFPDRQRFQKFNANRSEFMFLDVTITATQQSGGTDPTRFTPNCLPIVIEGHFV